MSLLALILCLTKMSAVMLSAGALARLIRKRSPDAAAKLGTLGVLASLALLLMAILQTPTPLVTSIESPRIAAANLGDVPPITSSVTPPDTDRLRTTSTSLRPVDTNQPSAGITLDTLLSQLRRGSGYRIAPNAGVTNWGQRVAVLALSCAVVPLLVGVLATIQLHHRSESIEIPDLQRLQSLLVDLPPSLDVRVSHIVNAPCVTLYGGHSVYVPVDWKSWSTEELTAAILHESMHLRRRDALQRMTVQFASALQFFHPLAAWLRRGVMLSQEMAADRSAVQRQGTPYTVGLMKLALRMDASVARQHRSQWLNQWFMRPGIVSVSSSHLIRRIEMLKKHSRKCLSKRVKRLSSFSLVGLFAVCACWTVQADPPPAESKAATTAAAAPEQRVAALPRIDETRNETFLHGKLLPWQDLGPNDTGYFGVQAEQLLNQPAFGGLLSVFIEPHLDTVWREISRDDTDLSRAELGLSTKNISHFVGSLECEIKNVEPVDENDDKNSRFFASSAGGKLWFHNPIVHSQINESLDRGKIEQILKSGGVTSEDLNETPFPEFIESILSAMFEENQASDQLLLPPPEKDFEEAGFEQLKQSWHAVEGGVVALCYSLPDTIGYVGNEEDRLADKVLQQAACVGIGVDFHGADPAHMRIAFVPRSVAELPELEASLKSLANKARDMTRASSEGDEDGEVMTELELQILDSCTISMASADGGESPDIVSVTLRLPLEAFALMLP